MTDFLGNSMGKQEVSLDRLTGLELALTPKPYPYPYPYPYS